MSPEWWVKNWKIIRISKLFLCCHPTRSWLMMIHEWIIDYIGIFMMCVELNLNIWINSYYEVLWLKYDTWYMYNDVSEVWNFSPGQSQTKLVICQSKWTWHWVYRITYHLVPYQKQRVSITAVYNHINSTMQQMCRCKNGLIVVKICINKKM